MTTDCWRVEVKTTNGSQDTVQFVSGEYGKCIKGILYVTTQDPKNIHNVLGDKIITMERIGIGYHMMEARP